MTEIVRYPEVGGGGGAIVGGGAYSDIEAFAFDWTAQADFDFVAAGDGTYPIGGFDWTVLNTVVADIFRVENGNGCRCRIAPGQTNISINEGGMSAPGIFGLLHELMAVPQIPLPGGGTYQAINARDPISVWWHLQRSTPVNDAHITCALRQNDANGYSTNVYGGGPYRSAAAGDEAFVVFSNNRATTADNANALALLAQADVYVLRVLGQNRVQVYAGVWDGGWPTWDQMLALGWARWNDAVETLDLIAVPAGEWVATVTGILATAGQTEFLLQHQRITRG